MMKTISSDYEKSKQEREWESACDIARSNAVSYIGLSKKSSGKIAGWLESRGYPASVIEHVIKSLEEENIINDRELALNYIKNRNRSKLESAFATNLRLIKLGIDPEIASQCIENAYGNENIELSEAISLVYLKFSSKIDTIHELDIDEQYKLKIKIFRFLLNKGYTREIALSSINNVLKDNFLNDEDY